MSGSVSPNDIRLATEKIVSYVAQKTANLRSQGVKMDGPEGKAVAKAIGLLMNGQWAKAIVALSEPMPAALSAMEARMRFAEANPAEAAPPKRQMKKRRKPAAPQPESQLSSRQTFNN